MESKSKKDLLDEFKIKYDNIDDMEILEEAFSHIYVRNKKTNELIYASIKYFSNRQYSYKAPAALYQATKLDDVVHEKYYEIPPVGSKITSIKKALKKITLTDDSLIFQREYTNVDSKYGELCFVIENSGNPKYYKYDSKSSIGLFYGSSDKIIEESSSLEPTYYSIIKNFSQNNDFYNYLIGHNYGYYKDHLWAYKINNKFIYSIENVGAIIEDGSIDILDSEYHDPEYCPLTIYNIAEKYKKIISNKLDTKAYFHAGIGTILLIEKDKEKILLKLCTDFNPDRKPSMIMEKSLPKLEKGPFTSKEIALIIAALDAEKGKDYFTYLNKKTRKANEEIFKDISNFTEVKRALISYKNFKENQDNNQFNFTSPYCLPIEDFEKATEVLRKTNKQELVDSIIDNYIENFNITLKELLGDNKKAKEHMEGNLQFKKKINYSEPFKNTSN